MRLGLDPANADHQALYWLMKVNGMVAWHMCWTDDIRMNPFARTMRGSEAIVQHCGLNIETQHHPTLPINSPRLPSAIQLQELKSTQVLQPGPCMPAGGR